jgi:hypothetical protein
LLLSKVEMLGGAAYSPVLRKAVQTACAGCRFGLRQTLDPVATVASGCAVWAAQVMSSHAAAAAAVAAAASANRRSSREVPSARSLPVTAGFGALRVVPYALSDCSARGVGVRISLHGPGSGLTANAATNAAGGDACTEATAAVAARTAPDAVLVGERSPKPPTTLPARHRPSWGRTSTRDPSVHEPAHSVDGAAQRVTSSVPSAAAAAAAVSEAPQAASAVPACGSGSGAESDPGEVRTVVRWAKIGPGLALPCDAGELEVPAFAGCAAATVDFFELAGDGCWNDDDASAVIAAAAGADSLGRAGFGQGSGTGREAGRDEAISARFLGRYFLDGPPAPVGGRSGRDGVLRLKIGLDVSLPSRAEIVPASLPPAFLCVCHIIVC